MAAPAYIGSSLPAKIVVADGVTSLFRIAQREMGDALCWWQIASLNGLTDPMVAAGTSLSIPTAKPNNGGVPLLNG